MTGTGFIETDLGHWTTTKALVRASMADAATWFDVPYRASSLMLGNACIGTLRRQGQEGWFLRIEGFEWSVRDGMGAARFKTFRGDPAIKFTPVKLFPSIGTAKAEAAAILRDAAARNTPIS